MPSFSQTSLKRLATCHADLQTIMNAVIAEYDIAILCGYRGEIDQTLAYESGKSKLPWPRSRHNTSPSMAVDVSPYFMDLPARIDWDDIPAFSLMAGWILKTAHDLYAAGKVSHRLKWGADWDKDRRTRDHSFRDYPHFELIDN